jgi:acyltransferase
MTTPQSIHRDPHTQRWQWLDAAKGLGIALIVWGHIYSITEASALQVYVYAFHVPLFFFVSGLTFNPDRQTLTQVVSSKSRSLLLPYLCYALLGYAFYLAGYTLAQAMGLQLTQFDYGLWPPLIGVFYGSLGDGHLVNTPVWFVIALFCTLLIGQLLNQAVTSKPLSLLLALLIGAGGQWVGQKTKLPFSLAPAMLGLVFFQAAYLLKPWFFSTRITPAIKWLVLVICGVISLWSQVNGFVAVATPSVGHFGWFLLFGFAGSIGVIALTQLLEPYGAWLAQLGRYSLSIMVIHFLIIKSVKVVMTAVAHVDMTTMDDSSALGALVLLATMILLTPTVFVMERYLPWTLGKVQPKIRMAAGA